MNSQIFICPDCDAQALRDSPHPELQWISHVPALGKLFRCRRCSAYWEQTPQGEWEALLIHSALGENERMD